MTSHRAWLAEFLALVGEHDFSRRVRNGLGVVTPAEVRAFNVFLRRSKLEVDLLAIRLCGWEKPTKKGVTPRLIVPTRGCVDPSLLVTARIFRVEPPMARRRRPTRVRTVPTPGRHGAPRRQALSGMIRHTCVRLRELAEKRQVEAPRASRALALLLLLHELDTMPAFRRPLSARLQPIPWLVERIGNFVEDGTGSYTARKTKRA